MVFTQGPLSIGELFGHERRNASMTFFSDGDSGTPSLFVQAANTWYNFRDTYIVRFVVDGCRKNLPLHDLPLRNPVADISLRLLVLKTHDVSAVVAFYQSLGFTFIEEQHGKGPLHHSSSLGDGIIEIYPLPTDQSVDSTTRLGFAVADPDAAVDTADSLGGRVIKPGRDTPWGYMALVADPDDHTVELYRT